MTHNIYEKFPEITLDNIVLRQLELSDTKDFYNYMSDARVNRFICDDDIPKTIEDAERELKYWQSLYINKRSIYWAIAKKNNNTLIGTCGFNFWSASHNRAEISYDLCYKEWRKGIMTKSLRAICDFAFVRMNINRIQASVAIDNIASIKLLEKADFTKEGLLRQYAVLHKNKKDFYMYSLISSDKIVF